MQGVPRSTSNHGPGTIISLERKWEKSWRLIGLLYLLGFCLFPMVPSPPAFALSSGAVSITPITAPFLLLDSTSSCIQGPDAAYVGFQVTNISGASLTNLQATLGGFTTGFGLAGQQAATQFIGTLGSGQSRTLYWFIQYPCTSSQSDSLLLTLSDSNSGVVTTTPFTVTTTSFVSTTAAGQVRSSTLANGAVLGQILTDDVIYSLGTVNSGDQFSFQPAGNTSFNAGCLQLVASQITASGVSGIPALTTDKLYFTASQGGAGTVTVQYSFLYECAGVNSTATPYAGQISRPSNSYTGNYGAVQTAFPSATNPFTITKSATPAALASGGIATFTITIANSSSVPAVVNQIIDILPSGVSFAGVAVGSNVTATNSSSLPSTGATGTLTFTGMPFASYSVPANGSINLVFTANVSGTGGSYTNSATATSGAVTFGPATATIQVGGADLGILKTVNTASPSIGQNITYTVQVTNNGPVTATNVAVTDQLPSGLAFVSATTSQGAYTSSTGVWTVGTLAPQVSATLQLIATVTTTGSITNSARISASDQPDPNPANNQFSITLPAMIADLVMAKTVDNSIPLVGSTITFTVGVGNFGPSTATGVIVSDLLPSGLTFVSASPSQGGYNSGTGVWTVGTLANLGQARIQIVAAVPVTGTFINTAQVSALDQVDPNLTNDRASVSVSPIIICATSTATATAIPTPTPSPTPTPCSTATPSPTPTVTPTITNTPPSTVTGTPTVIIVATFTPTPILISTPLLTPSSAALTPTTVSLVPILAKPTLGPTSTAPVHPVLLPIASVVPTKNPTPKRLPGLPNTGHAPLVASSEIDIRLTVCRLLGFLLIAAGLAYYRRAGKTGLKRRRK